MVRFGRVFGTGRVFASDACQPGPGPIFLEPHGCFRHRPRQPSSGRLAQLVRAPSSHGGGHRFESCVAHFPGVPTRYDQTQSPRPSEGFCVSWVWAFPRWGSLYLVEPSNNLLSDLHQESTIFEKPPVSTPLYFGLEGRPSIARGEPRFAAEPREYGRPIVRGRVQDNDTHRRSPSPQQPEAGLFGVSCCG